MSWTSRVRFRYRLLRARAKREHLRRAEWMLDGEIPSPRRSTRLLVPSGMEQFPLHVMFPLLLVETGVMGRGWIPSPSGHRYRKLLFGHHYLDPGQARRDGFDRA